MGSIGFVFSQLIYQLPVAVVVVTGFALIPARRARIGARRANLAMAGLGLLVLEMVISTGWSTLASLMLAEGNLTGSGFRYAALTITFFLAILFAVAVALLLAAAVSPAPDPATPAPPRPYEPTAPGSDAHPT